MRLFIILFVYLLGLVLSVLWWIAVNHKAHQITKADIDMMDGPEKTFFASISGLAVLFWPITDIVIAFLVALAWFYEHCIPD